MPEITITRLTPGDPAVPQYAKLRAEMWDIAPDENAHEIEELLADQEHWAIFIATADGSAAIGFLEVRLRQCADGAVTSPVGYLEGWYVEPDYRGHGTGRMLVEAGENWARSRGCTEIGSDAEIDNTISIRLHHDLGYAEVDRVVRFVKKL
jgi:aminoglycoside 6'-N-acetyltransferase I